MCKIGCVWSYVAHKVYPFDFVHFLHFISPSLSVLLCSLLLVDKYSLFLKDFFRPIDSASGLKFIHCGTFHLPFFFFFNKQRFLLVAFELTHFEWLEQIEAKYAVSRRVLDRS